jgi:hypothetical protein
MDPAKLIGDVITALTFLAVLGVVIWFVVTRFLPFSG